MNSGASINNKKALHEILATAPDLSNTLFTTIAKVSLCLNKSTKFTVVYQPPGGLYHGGEFRFSFEVSEEYPHKPPKVLCVQKIYHPNIDTEGHVCLNVLREDWKPVLSIQSIIFGLQLLFMAPNPEDPLNNDAAQNMINDPHGFKMNVTTSMRGGSVKNAKYDCVLAPTSTQTKGRC
ncbi:NEDD8-conjugating protein ubc12 [Coemansia sp. RSA 2050]|nr:NEDD8-conjugating protein ubc12 [Coemansia sp. RSA 2050]